MAKGAARTFLIKNLLQFHTHVPQCVKPDAVSSCSLLNTVLDTWAQSYQPKIQENLSVFCTDFQISKNAN
jgi:hypothetical protein